MVHGSGGCHNLPGCFEGVIGFGCRAAHEASAGGNPKLEGAAIADFMGTMGMVNGYW
jgi:hypothetical protein